LDSHSHEETLALRVQFDTPEQQKDASVLGMWGFLITEIMFFGGMFLAYTLYRSTYPHIFAVASSSLNVYIGAFNTVVLLCSSFTMVMAVRAAQLGQRKAIILFLILTLILGGASGPDRLLPRRNPGRRPGPRAALLLAVFRDDRPARAAHGGWRRTVDLPDYDGA
jgi:hypothetical protein